MEENKLRKISYFIGFISIVLIFMFCMIFEENNEIDDKSGLINGIIKTQYSEKISSNGVITDIKDYGNYVVVEIEYPKRIKVIYYENLSSELKQFNKNKTKVFFQAKKQNEEEYYVGEKLSLMTNFLNE